MDSFLKIAAKDIFQQNQLESLRDIQVILPSRRAVYYFKKELSNFSDKPFFLPKIWAIDDFLIEKSGLKLIDNVSLYLRAFQIWKRIDADQSIETFLQWIPTLLKDFENIDFSLVEQPHQLFKYMSEAQAIERWGLSDDFQFSANTMTYFSFFDKVAFLYEELQKDLIKNNECSRGQAYRMVSLQKNELFGTNCGFHYFIGLNALSKAEEEIIQHLVKNQKAFCIWDTDTYYMNSGQKAGKKLLQYKKTGQYGTWNYEFDYLTNSAKNIRVFEVPNESAQIKLLNNIVLETGEQNHVLAVLDEAQFEPLILNLPQKSLKLNVSIGIPLSHSKVSGLIKLLIVNYIDFQKNKKIHRNSLMRFFELDIFKELLGKNYIQIEKIINKSSKFYFEKSDFNQEDSKLFSQLFEQGNTRVLIEILREWAESLIEILREQTLEITFCNVLISKLSLVLDQLVTGFDISVKAFEVLITEMLKNEKLPFEGDQNTPLQIMSLLETRCLDFENVTLMSFNEGFLPSNTRSNSFISNDAAYYFNLPQYTDQDSIMAYHFLRLLQRAKNINFVYLTGASNEMTIKEKSRFISQIENQLIPKNPKINIFYTRIVFENENIESAEKQNIVIKKNEFILKNIKKYLENNGLSPTTLNNYIECPLRFYWLNVEKLKPENEISETIMVDTFGVILHAALELIDKDKGLKSKEELEFNRINIPAVIEKVFTELKVKVDNQQGINYLLKNVAEKLLDQYFEMRIANFQNPYEIIDNEIFLEYSRLIGDSRVKFKGTIDKIEKHGNTLELIDFKSGEVDFSKTGNKTIEEIFSENKLGKQRQLYFYIYLVFKNISIISVLKNNQSDLNLKARIYSFRNLTKDLSLEQIELKDQEFVKTIDETLEKIVLEILNPEVEIVQTEEKKNCQYCDFRNICKRE